MSGLTNVEITQRLIERDFYVDLLGARAEKLKRQFATGEINRDEFNVAYERLAAEDEEAANYNESLATN